MPAQPSSPKRPGDGWRARKRQQTRRRIADVGLRLFLAHGFEATTLDAIAEAAGIARRTFFHYFDSKEALLYAYEEEVEHSFRATLADLDNGMPPFEAMILAVRAMIATFDTDRVRALITIAQSSEALRASMQADHQRVEDVLYAALARKWPLATGNLRLRLVAMVGMGALRIAVDRWRTDPLRSLSDHVDDTFAALRAEWGT